MNMTFLHISDTHYLHRYPPVESGYMSIFPRMTNPLKQLDLCFESIDPACLDFVLLSGDLTERGDAEDYRRLKKHLAGLLGDIPLVVTLGNHDIKQAFYEGWLGMKNKAGPYNRVEKVGPLSIISLDSSIEGLPDGLIGPAQCRWLADTLHALGDAPSLLMTHHHLLENQCQTACVPAVPEFMELVAKSHILGIFCGHTHHNYAGSYAGKPYFTADSLSFVGHGTADGQVRFEECSGAALFTLTDSRFALRRIPVLPQGRELGCIRL